MNILFVSFLLEPQPSSSPFMLRLQELLSDLYKERDVSQETYLQLLSNALLVLSWNGDVVCMRLHSLLDDQHGKCVYIHSLQASSSRCSVRRLPFHCHLTLFELPTPLIDSSSSLAIHIHSPLPGYMCSPICFLLWLSPLHSRIASTQCHLSSPLPSLTSSSFISIIIIIVIVIIVIISDEDDEY